VSDNLLTVIPVDPGFTPQRAAADAAALVLKTMAPASDQVTAETFACVEFVDPGGNFEKINCPGVRNGARPGLVGRPDGQSV
jgi:hypothetical protein